MTDVRRAAHDLNNVHTLHLKGWGADNDNHLVRPVDDSTHVALLTPQLPGTDEFWTFEQVKGGVLNAHSNLLGSPQLIATRPRRGVPLIIELPRNKEGKIKVIVE